MHHVPSPALLRKALLITIYCRSVTEAWSMLTPSPNAPKGCLTKTPWFLHHKFAMFYWKDYSLSIFMTFVHGQQEQEAPRKMRMHKCISLETMFWFYSLQIFMFQVLTLQAYTRAHTHTHTVLAYHLWAVWKTALPLSAAAPPRHRRGRSQPNLAFDIRSAARPLGLGSGAFLGSSLSKAKHFL